MKDTAPTDKAPKNTAPMDTAPINTAPSERFAYADIVDMPRHVSAVHPRMSISDRAAQFSPFAALTGYGDAVEETARYVEARPIPDEEQIHAVDAVLRTLRPGDTVTVCHFVPDRRKPGGAFTVRTDAVTGVDVFGRTLRLRGFRIAFDDIFSITPVGAVDGG